MFDGLLVVKHNLYGSVSRTQYIDDLMITNEGESYYLVVNASRTKNDLDEIFNAAKSFKDISINHLHSKGMIALQGPKAIEVIKSYFDDINKLNFMDYKKTTYKDVEVRISRVGYTGEDGFEISTSKDLLLELTQNFLNDKRVSFCGLGARDTLRLEAGLCLYGHDINESTSPIEANLKWAISQRRREEGGFVGYEKIKSDLNGSLSRLRVGIKPEGKIIAREGVKIFSEDGKEIGSITSGTFGPSVNGPIAMGYVKLNFSKPGTKVFLEVRGKKHESKISELPFYKKSYVR